jgi:phosphoribosylanthranilate isomerase
MRIKVCGTRNPENIEALSKLPLDFIGFIFYPKSPRYAGQKKLEQWMSKQGIELLGSIAKVGVFVNAEIEEVVNRIHDFELDFIQLHGTESPEYCKELFDLWGFSSIRRASIIKAFSIDENFDFASTAPYTSYCKYFLFDTKGASFGGNGTPFDWHLLDNYQGVTPFFLSGGIGPESVTAIREVQHPQLVGIDINSKFETEPGEKDVALISEFLQEINN